MKAGILGLAGSGRRTLFSLLTHAVASGSGREAQLGVLKIPDERLQDIGRLHGSRKITPATIQFVLVPGLVKGESTEKLDLPALRAVEVLVHVVRAFEEPSVPHPEGSVDPARDVEIVELELTLADLTLVERRLKRLGVDAGKGKKIDRLEHAALERARESLAEGNPLRSVLSKEDGSRLRGYALLTAKPLLLLLNVSEDDAARKDLPDKLGLVRWTKAPEVRLAHVSAKIEAEMAELSSDDAQAFRESLGLAEDTVERIVSAAFDLLGTITFYTSEEKETRAHVIPRGTPASVAAGSVHSDMARGFIRAEVVPYDVLKSAGSWSACREKGLLRLEGKEHPIADGDVVIFRFNV
jgi:GTP-binding protein YchF